jgi:hypothetical protein
MLTLLNTRLVCYSCDKHNCPFELDIWKLVTFRLASFLWYGERYSDAQRLGRVGDVRVLCNDRLVLCPVASVEIGVGALYV